MSHPKRLLLISLVVTLALAGCAKAAKNTEGFAITNTATINKPMPEAWQLAKEVLREQEFDIYTRDLRGVFVAYSKMKRTLFLMPHRVKYTIALESVSDNATKVTVETIKQVYGVTLLTYPGWHDRKATDDSVAKSFLSALEAKAGAV